MQIERRVFLVDAELRAASDGRSISGYAARYNTLSGPIPASKNGGYFRERILPGAFKQAVDGGQDVTCLVNHDADKLLGRTSSGTLQLRDSATGLHFNCSMPDTQLGRDTHTMIQRGDLNGCSFGFGMGERSDEDWSEEDIEDEDDLFGGDDDKKQKRSKQIVRTIKNFRTLYDVSVVTRPAYPKGTCVQARAIDCAYPEIPIEVRSAIESTEERLVRQYGARKVFEVIYRQGARAEEARSRRRNLLNQV